MLYLINSYIPVPISTQVYNKVLLLTGLKVEVLLLLNIYLIKKKRKHQYKLFSSVKFLKKIK